MKLFNFGHDNEKKIIEALKEQDTKRRDEEINAVKKLARKVQEIATRGDIEIVVVNVNKAIKELK